jgi:hypothetical protein
VKPQANTFRAKRHVDQPRRFVAVNLALFSLALLFTETKGTRT